MPSHDPRGTIRKLRKELAEVYGVLREAHDAIVRARTKGAAKECWCIYCERSRPGDARGAGQTR